MAYRCEVWINPIVPWIFSKKFIPRTILIRRRFYYLTGLVFILTVLFLTGCAERQLTIPTPQMDAPSRFWIRVLLLDDITACHIKADSPFDVIDAKTNLTLAKFRYSTKSANLKVSAGKFSIAERTFAADRLILEPHHPFIFSLNGDQYRGKLEVILNPDSDTFDAVNLVPLEPYLAGVVGAEMPDYWELEALKAQAIAARTYCLYIKEKFGKNRNWDLTKTQAHQVYKGLAVESNRIWQAVNATKGALLYCKHIDGTENIFPAYYSSTCGGHTENSKNVFGDTFEPLIGVRCPYCRKIAKPRFFFWSIAQFKKDLVSQKLLKKYPKLKPLGTIEKIAVAKQTDYGGFSRATKIQLTGSTGKSGFLRAEDLRLTIDPTGNRIKSTACKIVDTGDKWNFVYGRGYGHAVGLCQCGAQGIARKGATASQILHYYYPNSRIINIY